MKALLEHAIDFVLFTASFLGLRAAFVLAVGLFVRLLERITR